MSSEFLSQYKKWQKEQNQFGKFAFARFTMLCYLEALNEISNDFVFKGGNLLWHYIKTPRSTVDLDLTTITENSHKQVRSDLNKACIIKKGITYKIEKYIEIDQKNEKGAKITLSYETEDGQKNKFNLDIVFSLPTDLSIVKSTITNMNLKSASIENIIADKLAAAFQFRGGNTRMKDFDDLWRIVKSEKEINKKQLKNILVKRGILFQLDLDWVQFLDVHWKKHIKLYKDLPRDLNNVFVEINDYLALLDK